MEHPYVPKVNDYVRWSRSGFVDEGWVYFVGDEYLTIETHVKDKPNCEYTVVEKHKKIHVLIVCHHWNWYQLEYIKSRENHYE